VPLVFDGVSSLLALLDLIALIGFETVGCDDDFGIWKGDGGMRKTFFIIVNMDPEVERRWLRVVKNVGIF
jgi:hypothetical protein